jgi:hypothetical protein
VTPRQGFYDRTMEAWERMRRRARIGRMITEYDVLEEA